MRFFDTSTCCRLLAHFVLLTTTVCRTSLAQDSQIGSLQALLDEFEQRSNSTVDSCDLRDIWDQIVANGVGAIVPVLEHVHRTDSRKTANWLGAAVDRISCNASDRHDQDVVCDTLSQFVESLSRSSYARRIAFELLETYRPAYRDDYLSRALGDPVFGEEAAVWWIARADAALADGDRESALSTYRRAFEHSTDFELCQDLAKRLNELGQPVPLGEQLGVLREWAVIGPFPGYGNGAFDRSYPPETSVRLDQDVVFDGKTWHWRKARLDDDFVCDLKAQLGDVNDAVAFAYTELISPYSVRVELRAGADDNLAVWFNGDLVFRFPYYSNNLRADRHRVMLDLKKGVNTLLLKVAEAGQDPESSSTRPPRWRFVARLVNEQGYGVRVPVSQQIEQFQTEDRNEE